MTQIDYFDWFPKRLSSLRMQNGVSARDMSLSLGQSENLYQQDRESPCAAVIDRLFLYLRVFGRDSSRVL